MCDSLRLFCTALIPALSLVPVPGHAASPDLPSTVMAKPVKLLVEDPLRDGTDAGTEFKWRTAKGAWTRSSEGIKVAEVEADKHGAVGRLPVKLQNFVLTVDVRLDGAKSATISINDEKEHVARIGVTPAGFYVRKDDHDHDGPDRAIVFFNSPQKIEAGQWHSITLEMAGDTMVGTLDGKTTGWGSDVLLKAPKANPGLTVAGVSASFRNFRIWEAAPEPKEDWAEAKQKLPVPNTKPAEPAAPKKAAN